MACPSSTSPLRHKPRIPLHSGRDVGPWNVVFCEKIPGWNSPSRTPPPLLSYMRCHFLLLLSSLLPALLPALQPKLQPDLLRRVYRLTAVIVDVVFSWLRHHSGFIFWAGQIIILGGKNQWHTARVWATHRLYMAAHTPGRNPPLQPHAVHAPVPGCVSCASQQAIKQSNSPPSFLLILTQSLNWERKKISVDAENIQSITMIIWYTDDSDSDSDSDTWILWLFVNLPKEIVMYIYIYQYIHV